MLKLTIGKGTFINAGTIISLHNGAQADISINEITMENCVSLLEERDPPGVLQKLGLPPETPVNYLLDVVKALRSQSESTFEERMTTIKGSQLWPFVERSSNLTTVLQGLFALAASAFSTPVAL